MMTIDEKEQYDRTIVAALNADRFGFVETAKALRELGRLIIEGSVKHSLAGNPRRFTPKACQERFD